MNKKIIDSFDTTNLYLLMNKVKSPKAVVIIVHGLAEYGERYNYFANALNSKNISVYRFDLRGHGKSGGQKGWVDKYEDYINDLGEIVSLAKKENENLPVFIFGHSMGGFISAGYGIKHKNEVDGIILSAAALRKPEDVKGIKGIFVSILNKIYPSFKMKNNLGKLVSRDKKIVEKYEKDPLILRRISIKLYYEFLIEGIDWLQKKVKGFNYKTLILHGKDDKIINHESSIEFMENISSDDKNLIIYDDLYHEILNEKEKDKVIIDIINWIEERI
ncbi:MAG TPA: alpha/beta hydrolase [Clostridiales bacterium]|jgi:alpha-beta hydrolase superfamily lysophospholipase|nr:alpha/beta hydrolase [Clostridiales bacterium]